MDNGRFRSEQTSVLIERQYSPAPFFPEPDQDNLDEINIHLKMSPHSSMATPDLTNPAFNMQRASIGPGSTHAGMHFPAQHYHTVGQGHLPTTSTAQQQYTFDNDCRHQSSIPSEDFVSDTSVFPSYGVQCNYRRSSNILTPPPDQKSPASPFGKDWASLASSSEVDSEPQAKHLRLNTSPVLRSDGIRKKNAKFEIPADRTIARLDKLIATTSNEHEVKEYKQQKRLLRNREAALHSRKKKKEHTETLEKEQLGLRLRIEDLEKENERLRENVEKQLERHLQSSHEMSMLREENARLQGMHGARGIPPSEFQVSELDSSFHNIDMPYHMNVNGEYADILQTGYSQKRRPSE